MLVNRPVAASTLPVAWACVFDLASCLLAYPDHRLIQISLSSDKSAIYSGLLIFASGQSYSSADNLADLETCAGKQSMHRPRVDEQMQQDDASFLHSVHDFRRRWGRSWPQIVAISGAVNDEYHFTTWPTAADAHSSSITKC